MSSIPSISKVQAAVQHLKDIPIVKQTGLDRSRKLSEKYEANIYLKREDMQPTRSFKIRGAVNYYLKLSEKEKKQGVIAASDGNFSLACAFVSNHFKIHTTLFLTKLISQSKIDQIKDFGKEHITIIKQGDYFEETFKFAKAEADKTGKTIFHPFDSNIPIEANGTIAWEIVNEKKWDLDYLFTCIGGGGLAAGLSIVINELSPDTKIIGVEPEDTCSMKKSLEQKKVVELDTLSRFCDGSAVKKVGDKCFNICKQYLDKVDLVSEGQISSAILQLYDNGI